MKIIRMGLRPWESPRRLQKPVEIALRTLIVVTTADTGRKSEEATDKEWVITNLPEFVLPGPGHHSSRILLDLWSRCLFALH